ncbi:MAG: hypothetical protein K0S45_230 [Nitrospira sp.]|nr:hypothetical protein [Nitrospira sp.]
MRRFEPARRLQTSLRGTRRALYRCSVLECNEAHGEALAGKFLPKLARLFASNECVHPIALNPIPSVLPSAVQRDECGGEKPLCSFRASLVWSHSVFFSRGALGRASRKTETQVFSLRQSTNSQRQHPATRRRESPPLPDEAQDGWHLWVGADVAFYCNGSLSGSVRPFAVPVLSAGGWRQDYPDPANYGESLLSTE